MIRKSSMAQGERQITGVDVSGDSCTVVFNGPVTMRAGDDCRHSHEGFPSSRLSLKTVGRVNVLLRRWCRWKQRDRINLCSWKNTNVGIIEDYKEEGLSEPAADIFPTMKMGFRFFKGDCAPEGYETHRAPIDWKSHDYVQQEGFSLHAPVHDAENITFDELVEVIEKREHRLSSIIGPAGSGKTTLVRRLTRAIMQSSKISEADTNENLVKRLFNNTERNYEAVLYINFKDIAPFERISVPELLLKNIFRDISDQEFKEAYLWLLENQSKLLFVMDGFDQSSFKISNEAEKIGHWDEASTSTIIHNLFTGNIFPNAQIVFSSRENAVASLPSRLRPSLTVALVGLTSQNAQKLFVSLIGEGGESTWEHVRSTSTDLVHLSKIPLFLLFVAIVMKNRSDDRVYSMSGVLSRIIQILPKSNNTIKGEKLIGVLKKLMKMAFCGMKERRVTFTYEDLKNFGLDKHVIKDLVIGVPGLNALCQNLFDGDYVFFFCHQTIQEILAAYYIRSLDLAVFSDFVNQQLCEDFWFVVFRLLYGVSLDKQVLGIIGKDIVPEISPEKQDVLRRALKIMLKMPLSPLKRLNLLWIISESSDVELLESYGSEVKVEGIPILGDGIYPIASLAAYFKGLNILRLWNCGIDTELLYSISTCMAGFKLKQVDISENIVPHVVCNALEEFVKKMSVEEFIMDFPHKNCNVTDTFDLAPCLLTEIVQNTLKNIGKFFFKLQKQNMLLFENELHVLSLQNVIGQVNELYLSIVNMDQVTIDGIFSILDHFRTRKSQSYNFKCYLVIENIKITASMMLTLSFQTLRNFIVLARKLHKVDVKCLSLRLAMVDDNFLKVLENLPGNVNIQELDLTGNTNISDVGWKWLGQIVSRCKVQHFGGMGTGLTDSKVKNFTKGVKGAKICHLNVQCNSSIGAEGWFCIGKMVKENGLKVLETDLRFSGGLESRRLLDGANGAKIDILCVFDTTTSILKYVKEDAIPQFLQSTEKRIILKMMNEIEEDTPRVWDIQYGTYVSAVFPRTEVVVSDITASPILSQKRLLGIALTWKPPPNYSHLFYDIDAKVDGTSLKQWVNYKGTSMTITSLPSKGVLHFEIHTRLFYKFDEVCIPGYSDTIDLAGFDGG